jgi:hypothetical protein
MLYTAQVDGCIRYHGYDDTFAKELALILSENPRDLEMTLGYMETHGLIELIGENIFLLPHVPPMIMQEGESNERVRLYRERQKQLPETKKTLTQGDTESVKKVEIVQKPSLFVTKPSQKGEYAYAREEFIKFRLRGSSINNPIAFEESLRKGLDNPDGSL